MLLFTVFLLTASHVMSEKAPKMLRTFTLNDGNKIPLIALGTYGSDADIAKMRQTITLAVETGFRHIDTASLYRNEEQIGLGIQDVLNKGKVKREDLFITTKLWNDMHRREQVVEALRDSLSRLRVDYVDLYLIHSPTAENSDGSKADIDYLETWKGMEDAKKLGLTKSIGVSNFDIDDIDRLWNNSEIKPAVNEIEVNPTLTQEEVVAHCQKLGIAVMSYSPFGFLVKRGVSNPPPPRPDDPVLTRIANKYGKTANQVVLRYLIDRGTIPIPKSTNKDRLKENFDVFDFQLTPEEIAEINKFNRNQGIFDVGN